MSKYTSIVDYLKQKDFSGVVLIKRDNEIIFSSATGYANRSWQVPITLNTLFYHASITKMFTGVAILKLQDSGQLNLNDPISKHLDFKNINIDSQVTIYQLLTHTSGIKDYIDESNPDSWEKMWRNKPNYLMRSLKDYLTFFDLNSLQISPGNTFSYCNLGYILLGMVIEGLTSISYHEFIRNEIFDPLQLNDTNFIALDDITNLMAEGYTKFKDDNNLVKWRKNIYSIPVIGISDGGAVSNAQDLTYFMRAIRNQELLSQKSTKIFLTPQVLDKEYDKVIWKYGISNWFLIDKKTGNIVRYGHPGEDFGVSARVFYYPEQNIDMAILSNVSNSAGAVGSFIHDKIVNDYKL
jgi:CubicO group peptidase (beta-lactamase class C family)